VTGAVLNCKFISAGIISLLKRLNPSSPAEGPLQERGIINKDFTLPVIIIFISFLIIPWQLLFALEVKEPVKPLLPGVETPALKSFETGESQKGKTLEALIYVHGMDAQKGRIHFPSDAFTVEITGVNPPGRNIKIGDLRDISILQWKGRADKKEAFIFYPEIYVLNLRSGESVRVEKNILFFNTLKLEQGRRGVLFYSYFYDYYRRGSWVNRGEASPVPEASNPVKGSITGIRLFP